MVEHEVRFGLVRETPEGAVTSGSYVLKRGGQNEDAFFSHRGLGKLFYISLHSSPQSQLWKINRHDPQTERRLDELQWTPSAPDETGSVLAIQLLISSGACLQPIEDAELHRAGHKKEIQWLTLRSGDEAADVRIYIAPRQPAYGFGPWITPLGAVPLGYGDRIAIIVAYPMISSPTRNMRMEVPLSFRRDRSPAAEALMFFALPDRCLIIDGGKDLVSTITQVRDETADD